jgi:serine/threonine protein kinase
MPGDTIAGKYTVSEVLGRGGVGVILAAVHQRLGHRVAIKMLLPEHLALPGMIERFEREARVACVLRSPHAVRVMDVDATPEGVPYIVMELLVGRDLAKEAKLGPIPLSHLVDWIVQSCSAVDEAHALGIVHRDLKPSNIFLSHDGEDRIAKVVDFGASKLVSLGETTGSTGAIFGTPHYMSPEQVRSSRHVDGRADVWALGVVMYRLLSGRFPFEAESASALAVAIATEPPVGLDVRRPELPAPLVRAIMRALEKRPDKRFTTAAELAEALAPHGTGRAPLQSRATEGPRVPAPPSGTRELERRTVLPGPLPAPRPATEPGRLEPPTVRVQRSA